MLANHKILIIWLLGAISGFTLMISGNSLNYWLAKEQIDIKTIGLLAFILLPYSINFIWTPIFDSKRIKFLSDFLGNRLAWICIIQGLLAVSVSILSIINPQVHILIFAVCALFVSLFSSTSDALFGALKTELITKEEQGRVAGVYIFGYRTGMLISGSFAIYLSSFLDFSVIYKYFVAIIIIKTTVLVVLVKNTASVTEISVYKPEATSRPMHFILNFLKPIGNLKLISLILVFLILYRLPDNFINMMINPFLIQLGFDAVEIASAGKLFGVCGAISGGLIAGYIMRHKTIIDSLLIFGIMHAGAHSLFIAQEYYGKNIYMLFIVIGFESITGGMSMAAYIAFIASLCHGKYRATQYAFFSAMMGISRAILPAISGYIVELYSWCGFFIFTVLATLPSLILLPSLKKYMNKNNVGSND